MKTYITISLLIITAVSIGCTDIEKEQISIDNRVYDSLRFHVRAEDKTGGLMGHNNFLFLTLMKELHNPTAPIDVEFKLTGFVGDPGICKKGSFDIEGNRVNLTIADAYSGVDTLRPGFYIDSNPVDGKNMYVTAGRCKINSDIQKKLKEGRKLVLTFQTYNKTITADINADYSKHIAELMP